MVVGVRSMRFVATGLLFFYLSGCGASESKDQRQNLSIPQDDTSAETSTGGETTTQTEAPAESPIGDVPAADFEPKAIANIGAFNIQRLGQKSFPKDFRRLARLVDKVGYDVFAAVEVMSKGAAYELLDALRAETGYAWKLALSKKPSGESAYKEYFGYYYKSSVVKPVNGEETFCKSEHATQKDGAFCFAKDYRADGKPEFDRDPFVAHVKIGEQTYSLVAAHLIWGGSNDKAERRRLRELGFFREVMERVRKYSPDTNVIGLGDFNLYLDVEDYQKKFPNYQVGDAEVSPIMPEEFFNDGLEIIGAVGGPTTTGRSSYDHLLFFADNDSVMIEGSDIPVWDFNVSKSSQRKKFREEVSDHYPVRAHFKAFAQ